MTETLSFEDVQETIRHGLENGANTAQELTKILRDKGLNIEQPKRLQPTSGLLGRWAKHPKYGDVVCVWDETMEGHITVHYRYKDERTGTLYDQVPLASLTFPEQATKPEDVPAGEAWLVDVEDSEESHKSIVALKDEHDAWRVCGELMTDFFWRDREVTLISPLTPERPVSDLQAKSTERALDRMKAKYDELKWEYKQAQAEITWLKAGNTPRIVATEAEYAALPIGSIVAQPGELDVYIKNDFGVWERLNTTASFPSLDLAGITRSVLRYGWGDEQPSTPRTVRAPEEYDALPVGSQVQFECDPFWEKGDDGLWRFRPEDEGHTLQTRVTRTVVRYGWGDEQPSPAWRIEHDWQNLRVGEYIIDSDDGTGTVTRLDGHDYRDTDGTAYGFPGSAPFIVFSNKDAATPEAIEEAKNVRDKEMDK